MKLKQKISVIEALHAHGRHGCGIITLANQTNLSQTDLRDFLKSEDDLFYQLDSESKYAINRFGKYKGEMDDMIESLVKGQEKHATYPFYIAIAIAFLIGYLVSGI